MRLVLAILSRQEPVAAVCRRVGVSRQTGYKYLKRFRAYGRPGLVERSRRPARAGWPAWWRRQIERMRRRRPTWGGDKLRWWLRQRHPRRRLPAERTVQRWLQTANLVRQRKHKRSGGGTVFGQRRAARRCNEVWTVDYKGWFRTGRGQKIEPLTARDLYSRFLLAVTAVRNTSTAEARRVFRGLFSRYGLPRVIRADRGSPFCGVGPHGLTQLSLWWHRLGIRVEFVSRQRGVNNNAHEQMHAVLQAEVACRPARNRAAQTRILRTWRDHYNHHRPHASLGMRTPASRYRPSKRRAPRLRLPIYPAGWLVYRVKNAGHILVRGKLYVIGRAFQRLPVGLQPVRNRPHNVYFGPLLLGQLDLASDRSIRLPTR